LKLSSAGRWLAIAGTAVIVLSACSGTTASPSAAQSTAPSAAAGKITVGYLPKDIVNQYFAAAKTGVDVASEKAKEALEFVAEKAATVAPAGEATDAAAEPVV